MRASLYVRTVASFSTAWREVVDVHVLAEDGSRVPVGRLDWRARKAHQGCVRERIAEIACEPVDEVVLRPMRFVGHHHNLPPVREESERAVGVAILLSAPELLHRRRDDAAERLRPEQLAEVFPGLGLHRGLRERPGRDEHFVERLVIKVRSLRSVSITMVGFAMAGCRMSFPT